MSKRLILSGLMMAAIFSGCRKESDLNIPSANAERLLRSWKLVRYSGGLGGIAYTPASLGYEQTAVFDRNGRYAEYHGQQLAYTKPFKFASPDQVAPADEGVQIGDSYYFMRFSAAGDSLFLAQNANDGLDYIYVRE